MPRLATLWFRLRALFGVGRMERELDDEVRFHVEMETEKYLREGLGPEAARARALAAFGGLTRHKQSIRDGWGIGWARDAAFDVRLALRQLRLAPGYTLTMLLTLALGIGATTAIATLAREVLLRRPAVADPARLVAVYTTCRRGQLRCSSSYPDFADYRRRSTRLVDLAATSWVPLNVGTETTARLAVGQLVSGNYFGLLGLAPYLGRLIQPGDDEAGGGTRVVVLGYDFWRSALGADSALVGRTVRLNGVPFEVVGVGPPGFHGLALAQRPDVWLPILSATTLGPTAGAAGERNSYDERGTRWIAALVGRLAPGATLSQARQELQAVAANLAQTFPTDWAAVDGFRRVTVDRAEHYVLPTGREAELRSFLGLLLGTVVSTLLLACANVANLLLARATARGRELGIQLAVGAGRARIVRKLLTESLVLSGLGSAAGLLVAAGLIRALGRYQLPGGLAIGDVGMALDGPVLGLALTLAISTALVFGLAPAWHATRFDLVTFLKDSGSTRPGAGLARLRRALVTVQVALCLVLLAGAAVFGRTLRNTLRADLGFEPDRALMIRYNPGLLGIPAAVDADASRDLLASVRALPSVRSASLASLTPFQRGGFQATFAQIDGYQPSPGEEIRFDLVRVAGDYFKAMGIDVLDGRPIDDRDGPGTQLVAVVNRRAADLYWPGRSAVGGTITLGGSERFAVVGVVESPTWQAIGEELTPFVFLSTAQLHQVPSFRTLVVRTVSGAPRALPGVLARFREAYPGLSPTTVATMEEQLGGALMPQRLGSLLLTAFGLLALALAGVGIYGVVSYGVARQAREIGIRIAVGASGARILRTVLTGMAPPVLVGLGIGLVGAVALSGTVASFMYRVDPADPIGLAAVATLLLVTATAASLIPARRAARIDPVRVLVSE